MLIKSLSLYTKLINRWYLQIPKNIRRMGFKDPFYPDHDPLKKLEPFSKLLEEKSGFLTEDGNNQLEIQKLDKKVEIEQNTSKSYRLGRKEYYEFLTECIGGDITKVRVNNCNCYLIGANYLNLRLKSIYKSLSIINPDMVLVQIAPDVLLSNLEYYSIGMEGEERLSLPIEYVKQLIRTGEEVMPSQKMKEDIRKSLRSSKLLTGAMETGSIYECPPYKGRLTLEAIATIALWAENSKKSIILGDIPQHLNYTRISNNNSLLQLQSLLHQSTERLGESPDDYPRTPFGSGLNLYPDVLLHNTDEYISALLKSITTPDIFPPEHMKSIVCFLGYGQTRSLPHYLQYSQQTLPLFMQPSTQLFKTLLGTETPHMFIEKLSILDILFNKDFSTDNGEYDDLSFDQICKTSIQIIEGGMWITLGGEKELVPRARYIYNELREKYWHFAEEGYAAGMDKLYFQFKRKILK